MNYGSIPCIGINRQDRPTPPFDGWGVRYANGIRLSAWKRIRREIGDEILVCVNTGKSETIKCKGSLTVRQDLNILRRRVAQFNFQTSKKSYRGIDNDIWSRANARKSNRLAAA